MCIQIEMIRAGDKTKRKLDLLKDTHGFKSLDETLDYLLGETRAPYDRVMNWLAEIVPGGNVTKYVKEGEPDADYWSFLIYTERYRYRINVKKDGTYMGAFLGSQVREPGEDWLRGNDFPDGPISQETWDAIKNRIIRSLLLPLSREILSQKELEGIHTGDEKARELAQLRIQQIEEDRWKRQEAWEPELKSLEDIVDVIIRDTEKNADRPTEEIVKELQEKLEKNGL